MDMLRELIPRGGLGFSETGKLIDAVVQSAAQRVVAELDAVNRDDCKLRGQAAILRKVEQGRHELPPGQITGSAKNDEHRRLELVVLVRFHAMSMSRTTARGLWGETRPWRLRGILTADERGLTLINFPRTLRPSCRIFLGTKSVTGQFAFRAIPIG